MHCTIEGHYGGMIVTPTYSREMGEGGRLLPAARVPTLGLPDPNPSPTYKSEVGGGGVYKAAGMGGAYDHNKNSLSDKEGGSGGGGGGGGGGGLGPLPLTHHLPFTAPWLAEVAHITPARPADHLPYPPQPPAPPIPDYYPHYPGIPHRPAGFYPHHFLPPGASGHFLREYPRHAHRPYPPLDPRPPLERPTPVSGAPPPPLVRPLGPPPLRGMHPDAHPREAPQPKMRARPPDLTLPASPGAPPGEPSPKRRAGPGAFPAPAPRSPRAALRGLPGPPAAPGPALAGADASGSASVSSSSSGRPSSVSSPPTRPPVSGPILAAPVPTPTASSSSSSSSSPPEEPRPPSPYHAHFARGALVTVGSGVRRVEELETRDFLEAAKAAEDLMLDPSTVAAIASTPSRPGSSTITFTFPSRNTKVSVEASLDHPFFVLHSGWSSCSPERTQKKYDLKVRQLQVGDVCVSLTKKTTEAEATNPMPPPSTSTTQVPSPNVESSNNVSASAPLASPPVTQSSATVRKESKSLPFLEGSTTSSVWSKPAALRTTERQHSSDEAQREEKDSGRKRRWSDPGQAT